MVAMNRRDVLIGGGALAMAAWAAPATAAEPFVRRMAPGLDRVIALGTSVETIATGIRWAEGPVWVPGTGLLFSDPPANIVRRWTRDAGARVFLQPSGAASFDPAKTREAGANGLALAHDGALLIANSGGRSVDCLDLKTRKRTVLVDRFEGKRFNSPNDMTVGRDGAIWFTDPPYGLADGDASTVKEQTANGVYRWSRAGGVVRIDALTRPNGIGLSPDQRHLYVSVSDEASPRIVKYDLDAKGRPTASRVWLDAKPLQVAGAPGLPDGMKVARDGTMFCSAPGGMWVLTPEAEPLGMIGHGAPIANCAFGEGGRVLYLTANDRVLRVPLAAGFVA